MLHCLAGCRPDRCEFGGPTGTLSIRHMGQDAVGMHLRLDRHYVLDDGISSGGGVLGGGQNSGGNGHTSPCILTANAL